MNIIAWLEFELAYYNVTVKHISHYTMGGGDSLTDNSHLYYNLKIQIHGTLHKIYFSDTITIKIYWYIEAPVYLILEVKKSIKYSIIQKLCLYIFIKYTSLINDYNYDFNYNLSCFVEMVNFPSLVIGIMKIIYATHVVLFRDWAVKVVM